MLRSRLHRAIPKNALSRRRACNMFGIVRAGSWSSKSCPSLLSKGISVYSNYQYIPSSTDNNIKNLVAGKAQSHGFISWILSPSGAQCIRKLTHRLLDHMIDSFYQSCPTCTPRFIRPRSNFLQTARKYSTFPSPKNVASAVGSRAQPRITAEEARRAVEAARQRMYQERAKKNRSIMLYSAGSVSKKPSTTITHSRA